MTMSKDRSDYFFLHGLEEYLIWRNHPELERFLDIKKAIINGDPYKIRNLIVNEIYRGPIEGKTEEFAKALMSFYLDDEEYNVRRVLSYTSYCIADDFLRDAARWSIAWHRKVNINEHFSRGQILSKLWLVDKLTPVIDKRRDQGYPIDTIVQYGGWYATIAWFILKDPLLKQYYSIDIDKECVGVADNFNDHDNYNNWRFKALYGDVDSIEWEDRTFNMYTPNKQDEIIELRLGPQLIINTSCEHMTDDWFYNLPKDMMVCLQTNDYFSNSQHINCVHSVEEALEKYKFTRVYYSGELDTQLYKRFMIIGRT